MTGILAGAREEAAAKKKRCSKGGVARWPGEGWKESCTLTRCFTTPPSGEGSLQNGFQFDLCHDGCFLSCFSCHRQRYRGADLRSSGSSSSN
jgi:hypothetical protein